MPRAVQRADPWETAQPAATASIFEPQTARSTPATISFGETLTVRGGATAPDQTLNIADPLLANLIAPLITLVNTHPAVKLQVLSNGGAVTTAAATSAVFITGANAETITAAAGTLNQSVIGTNGDLVYNAASSEVLKFAGTGGDTINMFSAGTATVFAGSSADVNMGGAGMDFIGTSGSYTMNGIGTGTITAAATAAGATFYLAGSQPQVVALGSSGTINGAAATGNNVFIGGTGSGAIFGGSGNDLFSTGVGSLTMSGGGGQNAYLFEDAGTTSRTDLITDFNPQTDAIGLLGYGLEPGVDQAALNSAMVVGGNTVVTLSDGTKILLAGAPVLSSSDFF